MKRWKIGGFLLVTMMLSACSGPDVMYYTLSPTAPVMSSTQKTWNQPYRVGNVTVPAQVGDTALVVRQSSDQMMVLNHDRWSAPLNEQFRDALSQALTQQLGMPPMQNLASGSVLRDVPQITVDVQRFDLIPGKEAVLAAVWRISPMPTMTGRTSVKKSSELTCYSVLHSATTAGVAPLVAAQQNNVQTLSAQIAQVLQAAPVTATQTVSAPNCY